MIVIKFFSDWCDDKSILYRILDEFNWEIDSNYNNKYKFTINDDYTHAIILNKSMPNLKICKDNVIGLSQKPVEYLEIKGNWNIFKDYAKKYIKKYYIGNVIGLEKPFIQKMSYCLPHFSHEIISMIKRNPPKKSKLVNFVFSKKRHSRNKKIMYNYRYLLAEKLLENNINVDIYGSSTNILKKRFKNNKKILKNIKSTFEWKNIYEIYKDYKFSIVIENYIHPEYFSEKIMIPLLCGCIPIYIGCSNINNYFKDYVIELSGKKVRWDCFKIIKILNNHKKYFKNISVEEIEEKIHIKNLINEEFIK